MYSKVWGTVQFLYYNYYNTHWIQRNLQVITEAEAAIGQNATGRRGNNKLKFDFNVPSYTIIDITRSMEGSKNAAQWQPQPRYGTAGAKPLCHFGKGRAKRDFPGNNRSRGRRGGAESRAGGKGMGGRYLM